MRKIFTLFIILSILTIGCTQQPLDNTADLSVHNSKISDETQAQNSYEYDIRLTEEGFEAAEISVKKGSSLTVHIVEGDDSIHYLAIDGNRISGKELHNDDQANIPFDEEGTFVITDESTGADLKVNVE